jgi:hypothetical protein
MSVAAVIEDLKPDYQFHYLMGWILPHSCTDPIKGWAVNRGTYTRDFY